MAMAVDLWRNGPGWGDPLDCLERDLREGVDMETRRSLKYWKGRREGAGMKMGMPIDWINGAV